MSAPIRAVLVPDAAFWASAGVDPRRERLEVVPTDAFADALVVPERIPEPLVEGVRAFLLRLDSGPRVIADVEIEGRPIAELDDRDAGADDGGLSRGHDQAEEAGGGHGGHEEHGGMMEVSGEPSRDGLVMESSEVEIGPVSAALPTGLVMHATLDGDVVEDAHLEARLSSSRPPPDPLARAAWAWANARKAREPDSAEVVRRLAATEVERALGHMMWFASFAGLLGWEEARERAELAASPLISVHRDFSAGGGRAVEIDGDAEGRVDAIRSLLGRRSAFARRTRGLGVLDDPSGLGLAGPVARAAGSRKDARSDDPAYRELGFEPVTGEDGDAFSRADLRAEEASAALRLASSALQAGELPAGDGPVEGPRGPLELAGAEPVARGSQAARDAAAELARGEELSRALATIASFDLSPWMVGG